MNIFEQDKQYIANTYKRSLVAITHGKGAIAYGDDGREYIDLGSGIGVNSFGYCDDEWIKAVTDQLTKVQHTSNLYYTEPCAKLAEMLCQRTGMKKVFYTNSGAEANECAVKIARKYACDTRGEGKYSIVTLTNSFHGRTLTTLAATGQDAFHKHFLPLTEGFIYSEPDIYEIISIIKSTPVAAVMLETIRGEGGVLPLDPEFVIELDKLCHEHGILLMVDEVQTGNGRCGKLYSYMNYSISPDVVTTAKGVGGGLPIGITMMGEMVADVFSPGLNGSTFGGNPVSCAGAISVVERLTDGFLADVVRKGELVRDILAKSEAVESVTGHGLMLGIKAKRPSADIAAECLREGVLVLTAKEKVRLLPPLNIPDELLTKAVKTIVKVCEKV